MKKATESDDDTVDAPLEKTATAVAEPFLEFINAQSASAWILIAALLLAVGLANSPLAWLDVELRHIELRLTLGGSGVVMSMQHWVNDGLMALFFFLLGLELKRELLVGRLSDRKIATSVICAAIGGMAVPAILFLAIGGAAGIVDGWAIPIATDTAFALMVVVLLGKQVPAAARAFLSA